MLNIDLNDPQTYWLNLTNIGLGLATLAGLGLVVYAFGQEVLGRMAHRTRKAAGVDDHAFLTELGVTMADGGERTGKK